MKATGQIELGLLTHERRGGISELEIRIANLDSTAPEGFSHARRGAGQAKGNSDDD